MIVRIQTAFFGLGLFAFSETVRQALAFAITDPNLRQSLGIRMGLGIGCALARCRGFRGKRIDRHRERECDERDEQ
jgi:hypothetical protein